MAFCAEPEFDPELELEPLELDPDELEPLLEFAVCPEPEFELEPGSPLELEPFEFDPDEFEPLPELALSPEPEFEFDPELELEPASAPEFDPLVLEPEFELSVRLEPEPELAFELVFEFVLETGSEFVLEVGSEFELPEALGFDVGLTFPPDGGLEPGLEEVSEPVPPLPWLAPEEPSVDCRSNSPYLNARGARPSASPSIFPSPASAGFPRPVFLTDARDAGDNLLDACGPVFVFSVAEFSDGLRPARPCEGRASSGEFFSPSRSTLGSGGTFKCPEKRRMRPAISNTEVAP